MDDSFANENEKTYVVHRSPHKHCRYHGNLVALILVRDVQQAVFVFENFADTAAFDTKV